MNTFFYYTTTIVKYQDVDSLRFS